MSSRRTRRGAFVCALVAASALAVGAVSSVLGLCGPFTDVSEDAFCPFVLEVFYLGITTGTTPTTYDPASNVSRLQMAAFLSRSVDVVSKRASRRSAMNQYWTPQGFDFNSVVMVFGNPRHVQFDGADVWVSNRDGYVTRVRASDESFLGAWSGAAAAEGLVLAMNRVLVAGTTSPGNLYMIDPRVAPCSVTTVSSSLGNQPKGISYDGARVWVANSAVPGSVSIVTPTSVLPWAVTTVTVAPGSSSPTGVVFDGSNIWVTDVNLNTLSRLNPAGAVLQTVTVGSGPLFPLFDGTNIWVPNSGSNSISVVRAFNGSVLRTLTGNDLNAPFEAGFDGERILVTNGGGNSVSLWKAANLSPLGSVLLEAGGPNPAGVCGDGARFWVLFASSGFLLRF